MFRHSRHLPSVSPASGNIAALSGARSTIGHRECSVIGGSVYRFPPYNTFSSKERGAHATPTKAQRELITNATTAWSVAAETQPTADDRGGVRCAGGSSRSAHRDIQYVVGRNADRNPSASPSRRGPVNPSSDPRPPQIIHVTESNDMTREQELARCSELYALLLREIDEAIDDDATILHWQKLGEIERHVAHLRWLQ